jgi:integrase
MAQFNQKRAVVKPRKPHPDFPLFPHATKRWAKKVRGKLCYFGPWSDPERALATWLDQKDELLAGRTPRAKTEGLAIKGLANHFLTAKRHLLDTRELSQRTFDDYYATCARLIDVFGKTRLVIDLAASDFNLLRAKLAKTWGPVAVGNEINRIRGVFKYAFDAALIDRPVRYGPQFKRPSRKVLRIARAEKGPRLFEAEQLRKIIAAAEPGLRAMILLGINAGLGNSDCGNLQFRHLNLDSGWLNYPRQKTGVERRVPLWAETITALRAVIGKRKPPKDVGDQNCVFVTKYGQRWAKAGRNNPISAEFRKLLIDLKLHRAGLNFYALRHSFETIGGETADQVAVDAVMGHAPVANDMASVYRERINDDRLLAVTAHVRQWLFGAGNKKPARNRAQGTASIPPRPKARPRRAAARQRAR